MLQTKLLCCEYGRFNANVVVDGFVARVMKEDWGEEGPPYIFCVQWIIPCSPHNYSVTIYWCQVAPFDSPVWERFLSADDSARNLKFKMIPKVLRFALIVDSFLGCLVKVVEGSWIVKKSCGETPAILGKKLPQKYSSSHQFLEIDVDVTQNAVAGALVKMMLSYAKSLVN